MIGGSLNITEGSLRIHKGKPFFLQRFHKEVEVDSISQFIWKTVGKYSALIVLSLQKGLFTEVNHFGT